MLMSQQFNLSTSGRTGLAPANLGLNKPFVGHVKPLLSRSSSRSSAQVPRKGSTLVARFGTDKDAGRKANKVGGDRLPEPLDSAMGGSSNSYLALALVYGALAIPAAIAPHTAADFMFGSAAQPHDFLHEPLFRLLATGLVTASTVALSLKGGVKEGRLDKSAFQRLNIGLVLFATLNALLATSNIATAGETSVLTTNAFLASAAVAGLTIFVAWGGYGKSSEYGLSLKRAGPLPIAKRFQDDTQGVGSTLARRPDWTSVAYTLFTVTFAAAGLGYILTPEATLEAVFGNAKGQECVFLWRAIGAALFTLAAPVAYDLKEVSETGNLAAWPSKLWNVALSGAAAGHVLVFLPILLSGNGGPLLPALLGTWGAAGLVATTNLFAPQNED